MLKSRSPKVKLVNKSQVGQCPKPVWPQPQPFVRHVWPIRHFSHSCRHVQPVCCPTCSTCSTCSTYTASCDVLVNSTFLAISLSAICFQNLENRATVIKRKRPLKIKPYGFSIGIYPMNRIKIKQVDGITYWASLASIRKFLAKGLNVVRTHSTAYMNLDHPFLFSIDVSLNINILLTLFLNCKSLKPSGSPLNFLKSKEPQRPLRILMASLSWLCWGRTITNCSISVEVWLLPKYT